MTDKKNPPPIIILGMHRSGTSCLAGTLQQAGVYLGSVSTSNKYNKKGNRENSDIMKLNESLLLYNNASWDSPPQNTLTFDSKHLKQGKRIITELQKNSQTGYWGFKDPRFLLTQPFWKTLLKKPNFIGTIRHPAHVAYSINRRDNNFSLEKALELWLSYNRNLLFLLRKNPFPLISFDYNNKKYQESITFLTTSILGESKPSNINFFDSNLRTTQEKELAISDEVNECYSELQTFLT